jgi:hypothetical protein
MSNLRVFSIGSGFKSPSPHHLFLVAYRERAIRKRVAFLLFCSVSVAYGSTPGRQGSIPCNCAGFQRLLSSASPFSRLPLRCRWTLNRIPGGGRHPTHPARLTVSPPASLRSSSIIFSTFRLNGDRLAAAQPSCCSRKNSQFRHEATCSSTFCFSASDNFLQGVALHHHGRRD